MTSIKYTRLGNVGRMKVDLAHVSEGWEVMMEGSHIWWGLHRVDQDIMG